MLDEQELLDYDETNDIQQTENKNETIKDSYISRGFHDFSLKPELLRALIECGYEKPSEVQYQAIPQAILGTDILCQAKSGMGKTAVFIIATLQQLQPIDGQVSIIVLCHARELAYSISCAYERLCRYISNIKISTFFGGLSMKNDQNILKNNCPHIVLGTPGRILALAKVKALKLYNIKHFIIDECDEVLESVDTRRDVREIFRMTPREKQVLMFSATLNKEIRTVCKKFMQEPMEIYIDDETKLTLHNLRQHYIKSYEHKKKQKLVDLLEKLEFNQTIIFVKSTPRCVALCKFLLEQNFPAVEFHSQMMQQERLTQYQKFKQFQTRILVTTNLLGRGIDFEHVNIVFNYDVPENTDTYLHQAARTGRFDTKGLVITFISSKNDAAILNEVQNRFKVAITKMPGEIDVSTYK